jgi:replicative DNA helicase|tara:strand:+ start:2366 stop:3592 length:1227 start_codon:yes stop_codon:yes gene_type:complete
MTELSLLKTLLNKEFYALHKGIRCPDKIFTKDVRKVKQALDYAMETYDQGLSLADLEALFYATNKTLTTSNKEQYQNIFRKIANSSALNNDVANEVISRMFQQVVGQEVANIGFEYVNGTQNSLEPLRKIVENYQDDFTPNLKVEFEDMSIDTLLKANETQTQWKFNIPTLRRNVEGISGGHFVIVGARPNTGKTSFHASVIASPHGFADQGAKCVVLCNEEAANRVGSRYLSAATTMSLDEIKDNYAKAALRYNKVSNNIHIKDATGKDLSWVEAVVKATKPDILVLDMGDKFAPRTSDKSDVYLRDAAIHARNIAKEYNCSVFWLSQLSAAAEGLATPDQSMLEGSKTGKAAEADLIILIGKNRITEGNEMEDKERHINIAKNKLKGGFHGRITCQLAGDIAQYTA